MHRFLIAGFALFGLVACDVETSSAPVPAPTQTSAPLPKVTRTGRPQTVGDYRAVIRRVEPVAERACRQLRPDSNCDFEIGLDDRLDQQPNAFQTYDKNKRPVLIFNTALLRQMRNRDEVAFALAHEAAHHIEAHIDQTRRSAVTGAVLGAVLGSVAGLDPSGVDTVTNIGGTVGARRFSKEFELEADSLGALIAQRAGYDPLRGVLYFQDARDPGNQFLGTHPPNAERIRNVRNTVR